VSFAAFFSERLSDLLAVVLLALLGLSLYPDTRPVVAVGAGLVLVGLFTLTNEALTNWLGARVTGTTRVAVLLRNLITVLQQARHCHEPGLLSAATVLSVIAWAAEAWAFYLILGWMNVEASLTLAIFVYAMSMLGGALSFMPGGLGGAEAIMIALLALQGASHADAVAATVIIRVATLWFAVLLGLGASALRED
jgi:uncharacterized protein (TIRG00374 family)